MRVAAFMGNPSNTQPDPADDFVRPFRQAAEGIAERRFILVVERSIPDEQNKSEGYWACFGTDFVTGQPITPCDRIDRLAASAWAIFASCHECDLWWHPCR